MAPPTESDLIVARPEGLYCPAGDFFIDPWRPVERAVITHGHSDHARWGHAHYLAHTLSASTLRQRLGADIALQTLAALLPAGGATAAHQGFPGDSLPHNEPVGSS